ncbi:MAG: SPOR domain-containing protein [Proteobacteria bacterium]|nr:SPOR domain-containing protein [Pseudomonadota bacterium]MDE3207482.1 SPOR domain-containing protein [Pseudomonadota bacterium]
MANERLSDEAIQLKIRARRRLTGAIILSLAAVAVLPWALDSHPPSNASNLAVFLYPDKTARTATSVIAGTATTVIPSLSSRQSLSSTVSSVNEAQDSKNQPAVPQPEIKRYQNGQKTPVHALLKGSGKETAPEQSAVSAPYSIQLGLFGDPSNAKKLADRVTALHYRVNLAKVHLASGNAVKVSIGPFKNKTDAQQVLANLQKNGIKGLFSN